MNNTKYKFQKIESLNQLTIRQARYRLEHENRNVSEIAINRIAKKLVKQFKKIKRKTVVGLEASFTAMICKNTNKEIGFYINQVTFGISILNLVYVYPEFRGMGHFKLLMNHYEKNCTLLSCLEIEPNDQEFPKELYKEWGYTKTIGGILPNNYLLVRESEVTTLMEHMDKLNDIPSAA